MVFVLASSCWNFHKQKSTCYLFIACQYLLHILFVVILLKTCSFLCFKDNKLEFFGQLQPSFGKLHIFTAEGNEKVKIKNIENESLFFYALLKTEKSVN
jgi:hypothetical protein